MQQSSGNPPTPKRSSSEASLFLLALSGLMGAAGCGDDSPKPSIEPVTVDDAADLPGQGDAAEVAPPSSEDGGNADYDRDGVSELAGDCDDFNDTIYPGASEHGLDAMDSDCDGEDAPPMTLVWGQDQAVDSQLVDALGLLDSDEDGAISLDEFAAGCEHSAQLVGDARPGIVQVHASCAGNNACRGMVLQNWGELYEHSCRGSNHCAGWSCVETAEDQRRSVEQILTDGHCGYCHTSEEAEFSIPVPPSQELDVYLKDFWSKRSNDHLRSVIGFGVRYVAPDGTAVANMPDAYRVLSLAEIDILIAHLRTLSVDGHYFELPGAPAPVTSDAAAPHAQTDAGSDSGSP